MRGEKVRPLPGRRAGQVIAATVPDATAHWQDGGHRLRADLWDALVLPDDKPGAPRFRLVAIHDPRYKQPLLLASNLDVSALDVSALDVSAPALWRLYRDRWAVEQLPLSAKPMLGAERAFVFGQESRYRLPELSLLAGSLLSYVAATGAPLASGFWDRAARPTCGRLRRALARVQSQHYEHPEHPEHYEELPALGEQLRRKIRKKNSVTAHLKKGAASHKRHKAEHEPSSAT